MGTGGMRWGAGRPAYRAKGEQLRRIDVRQWARIGYLQNGARFSWVWHMGTERAGSISVQVEDGGALKLLYALGSGQDQKDASQRIALVYTPCQFGGARAWFACPSCGGRCSLLYMRWGRFACRHCQRVSYASQSLDRLDRLIRKQSKIETRLGNHRQRPKGMRRKTYFRICSELVEVMDHRETVFAEYVARLTGLAV